MTAQCNYKSIYNLVPGKGCLEQIKGNKICSPFICLRNKCTQLQKVGDSALRRWSLYPGKKPYWFQKNQKTTAVWNQPPFIASPECKWWYHSHLLTQSFHYYSSHMFHSLTCQTLHLFPLYVCVLFFLPSSTCLFLYFALLFLLSLSPCLMLSVSVSVPDRSSRGSVCGKAKKTCRNCQKTRASILNAYHSMEFPLAHACSYTDVHTKAWTNMYALTKRCNLFLCLRKSSCTSTLLLLPPLLQAQTYVCLCNIKVMSHGDSSVILYIILKHYLCFY